MNQESSSVNRSYIYTQLERALRALNVGESSSLRVQKWLGVIMGTSSGDISVGSRTPVKGTPAWVTLEVVTGGFATGRFMAQTELDEVDLAILERAPDAPSARQSINLWCLSDEGQEALLQAAESGAYRVDVPEHGALMVAALLNRAGHTKASLKLIRAIGPWMDRLKFSPVFTDAPVLSGALVHVTDAQEIREALEKKGATSVKDHPVHVMNTSIRVWLPLYDRLATLWLTKDDLSEQAWTEQALAWEHDQRAALGQHTMPSRFRSSHSPYFTLSEALRGELKASVHRMFGGEREAMVESALNRYVSKYGDPRAARLRALREVQQHVAALPVRSAIAQMVAARLKDVPHRQGLSSLEPYVQPAQANEHPNVFEGTSVPKELQHKLRRALDAPLEEHLKSGVIGSGEVLAEVLPQLTSSIAAAHYKDAAVRRLYTQVYAAFTRRRSLLLLNLKSQVGVHELPWVSALDVWKVRSISATAQARGAMREVVMAYMDTFAHTLMPNPLVSELQSLSRVADLDIALTEELAADIFMGRFTSKWSVAARQASELLQGTLYARYYNLPEPHEYDTLHFGAQCKARAHGTQQAGHGSWVAQNGTVIEQSQVLTSHNLAQLTIALNLEETLTAMAPKIVDDVFTWIMRELATEREGYINRLRATKNIAYAWRQMIFVMSLTLKTTQVEMVERMRETFDAQAAQTQSVLAFEPALQGLYAVMHGASFPESGVMFSEGNVCKRLLGWALGTHWLLA